MTKCRQIDLYIYYYGDFFNRGTISQPTQRKHSGGVWHKIHRQHSGNYQETQAASPRTLARIGGATRAKINIQNGLDMC